MEYQRIDENTIQCIITEEDMESFGLGMDEFLSHSGKADEFLQYIVAEAKDELGYEVNHGIVSMRLEVLNDGRVCLTFGNGNEKQIREQILKYLKEVAESQILREIERVLNGGPQTETGHSNKALPAGARGQAAIPKEEKDPYRIYCFKAFRDLTAFCHVIGLKQGIQSHLLKDKGKYYLIVDRYRISDYNFNLLTAVAFEYGEVLAKNEKLHDYLWEHGELLIENKAIGTLRKI